MAVTAYEKKANVIAYMDDEASARSFIKTIYQPIWAMQGLAYVEARSVEQMTQKLGEIASTKEGKALLLLDVRVPNAYEGVDFALDLVRQGTPHDLAFMTAVHGEALAYLRDKLAESEADAKLWEKFMELRKFAGFAGKTEDISIIDQIVAAYVTRNPIYVFGNEVKDHQAMKKNILPNTASST